MNVFSLTGNLGQDAEIKETSTGKVVVKFSMPVSTGFGDKKETNWLNCSWFGDRAVKVAQYMVKGSLIGVSGEFQPRKYAAKDGTEKVSLDLNVRDVTLLGGRPSSEANPVARPVKADAPFADDDVPF
jgi:single-strand DNA-binding protein